MVVHVDASHLTHSQFKPSLNVQDIIFQAVTNPIPSIHNILFAPEPVNDLAEAIEEVQRAINAWIYR